MEELKFNSTGPDASYLANINIFFATLFTLAIFKDRWHEDKLGSQSFLQKALDWFKQMFQGGLTGNRVQIAARREARKGLNVMIQKILYYIAIFADEGDIQVLISSGVVTKKSRKARRSTKAVPAT
ncbi:hypothetical protein GMST_31570 [Geomonas silvestris]|uniref:Uncharacterized protein n=1 Tax=Geomonas silvestris TaxID=2740184 RepID=A0A6V8MLI9_9BACT|nr:hypothetical protein [Geomonas silvestris]GFO60832.1 hypothetical protein GMST_31570 [Geomonas silvestris]